MRDAYCSFCRKHYREVGPLVEGPDAVYICAACVDLTQTVLDQESLRGPSGGWPACLERKVDRVARWVEDDALALHPRMARLIHSEDRQDDARSVQTLSDLCQAAALLEVVTGLLKRTEAKGLKEDERALLHEVETKAVQLKDALDLRAATQG